MTEDYGLLLNNSTFSQKVLRYQEHGINGIQSREQNSHYSEEFKESVILEYLEEK